MIGNQALGLALVFAGTATLLAEPPAPVIRPIEASPDAAWNQRFAGGDGWIGGDCVYSVALKSGRIVWFFGDTLLGKAVAGRRTGAKMVNNTVGVQADRDQATPIRFVAGPGEPGAPTALLVPADGRGWFWPQAPWLHDGRLFVFLAQIEKADEPGVFGFRPVAQWLARIDNPDEAPERWQVVQRKVPFATFGPNLDRSWGSAVAADGGHVYVFGYDEREKNPANKQLILARAPAHSCDDFATWQFFSAEGWSDRPDQLAHLAGGLAAEFSVSRGGDDQPWLLIYTDGGLSDRIVARTAASLTGPWSPAETLYTCPEMRQDKGVFSYAAKAHAWAAGEHELLVSYCVNTWDFADLIRNDRVYRPQFVRIGYAFGGASQPAATRD